MKFSNSMALVPLALDQCMGKNTRQQNSKQSDGRSRTFDGSIASQHTKVAILKTYGVAALLC